MSRPTGEMTAARRRGLGRPGKKTLRTAIGLLAITAAPLPASAVVDGDPKGIAQENRKAQRSSRRALVQTFASAFSSEPLARYFLRPFTSDSSRLHGLEVFFDWAVGKHATKGLVHASEDNLGAILWTKPTQAVDVGLLDLPHFIRGIRLRNAIEDTRATLHMGRVMGQIEKVQKRVYPQEYAYLSAIAVRPSEQRQGRGADLLERVLDRVDANSWPMALEAADPDNQAWYYKNGFKRVETLRLSDPKWGDLPNLWFMLRDAR